MTATIKRISQRLINSLVRNDLCWWAIKSTLVRVADHASWRRWEQEEVAKISREPFSRVTGGMVTLHGPFKGLRFASLSFVGSMLLPKLLGSYERELHPLIETICRTPYDEFINIGCGEGYYAVGLALRIPQAKGFAYDIDPRSRELCIQTAALNGTAERISVRAGCTSDILKSFRFSGKGLIVCDCEGYEKQLFVPGTVENLASCDLLIELHDFNDPTITPHISAVFQKTHEAVFIDSIDDPERLRTCHYPELDGMQPLEKMYVLREGRPRMQWVFLRSRGARAAQ